MINESLSDILAELRRFVEERDWGRYHDPKNLSMALVSEAGELAAIYRWQDNRDTDEWSRRSENRTRIEEEAADVGISLLLFCDRIGVDLLQAMQAKIAVNRRNYPVELTKGRSERPSWKDEAPA